MQSMSRIDSGTPVRYRFDGESATPKVERVHLARVGSVVDQEESSRVSRCSARIVAQRSAIDGTLTVVGCGIHSDLLRTLFRDPYVYV
jgi:hypothetical protein